MTDDTEDLHDTTAIPSDDEAIKQPKEDYPDAPKVDAGDDPDSVPDPD